MKWQIAFWVFIVSLAPLSAQNADQIIAQDSIETINATSNKSNKSVLTIFKGKPGRAALYSLVLPGAGQFYNKRMWKVPFVYALEGTAIYFVYTNTRIHKRWARCYESIVIREQTLLPVIHPISADCRGVTSVSDAFKTRNLAKTNREYSWLALVGAHLFQTLEAYINRHLIDFDVDEDLTFLDPYYNDPINSQIKLASLRLSLNRSYYKQRKLKSFVMSNP